MSAFHFRLVVICFLAFVCWLFSTPGIVSSSDPDLPQANVPADSAQGSDEVVPVLAYGDAQRSGVFSTTALDEVPRQTLWKSKKLFRYRESNETVAMSGPIRIVAEIPTFQTISRPIVSNGMIVFVFSTENAYLYAISASTGDELVVLKFAKNKLSSPAALGSTVFFGDRNGAHAFDFERRAERWAFRRKGLWFSYGNPVIDDGIIYMCGDGAGAGLYALSADTGEAKWIFESAQFLEGPAISGNKLILVNSQGSLLALDKKSGTKQWETKIDSQAFAPAILGDQIFVRFIDPLTGVEAWRIENKNDQTPIFADGVMYRLGTNGILSAMK